MSRIGYLLALGFLISACQQKPTKTYETVDNLQTQSSTAAELFQGEPVILDTRTPFDYNLSHVTGAVSIQWQDFSSTTPGLRGYLDQDTFALARRLALVGVHPQAKVIVIGYGPAKGQGEEGRVAWMLQRLGVSNVHTLQEGEVKSLNPRLEKPPKNASSWIPQVAEVGELDRNLLDLLITDKKPQVRIQTKARQKSLQIPREAMGQLKLEKLYGETLVDLKKAILVLDVRDAFKVQQEPLSKYISIVKPVKNILWRQFYNSKGMPSVEVMKTLSQAGIEKDSAVVVSGDFGVDSAATVYAMRALGYKRVLHFPGGIEELRSRP